MAGQAALLENGPLAGGPGGFQNVVIPCVAQTDGDTVNLRVPNYVQWFHGYTEQKTFGTIADAAPTGPIFVDVEGLGQKPVYVGAAIAEDAILEGDYFQITYDSALGTDGGFHLLNWSRLASSGFTLTTVGTSGPATFLGGILNIPVYSDAGNIHIVTDANPVTALADDGVIVLNKAAPSNTTITLPQVALRNGLPLTIVDFNGNGGDITVLPDGAETIMSLAQAVIISNGAGVGLAGLLVITPNVALQGWFSS